MSQILRKNNRWMDPPAWQQEQMTLIEIDEPNWNCWGQHCFNFTSAGGMSPFYQARVGGPMRRFDPPIAPGPTRSNCYEGCTVPGGVWYDHAAAFNGSGGRRFPWTSPETGIVHAIHPLNTMGTCTWAAVSRHACPQPYSLLWRNGHKSADQACVTRYRSVCSTLLR